MNNLLYKIVCKHKIVDFLIKKYDMIWEPYITPMLYQIYMKSGLQTKDLDEKEFKIIEQYTWKQFIDKFPVTDEFIVKYLNDKICQ